MEAKTFNRNDKKSWDWVAARHLLNRAGFGGKPKEIEDFRDAGFDASLRQLFDFDPQPLKTPEWLAEDRAITPYKLRQMTKEERKKLAKINRQHGRELQVAWIQQMIDSATPADMLWEKMTFFWHGHFATSAQKVRSTPLLFQQLSLFHRHAVGNFRHLLHDIARDAAMLHYLDNNQNRKGKPNENFARELMELFTLGPGHYTEQDVKESARAFTGWNPSQARFKLRRRQHDYGKKTFLGKSGNFDGGDIVEIILEQPACAEFITRKLLAFFSFETASEETVRKLAQDFRQDDYHLEPLLKSIFAQDEFYDAENVGVQIKSPIQLLIGTARTLGLHIENPEFYLHMLTLMGQVPFLPPNVKGWPGGKAWIDTSRLLTRYTFAEIVARGEIPSEIDPRSKRDPGRKDKTSKGGAGRNSLRRMMRQPHLGIAFKPEALVDLQASPEEIVHRLLAVLISQEITAEEQKTLVQHFENNLVKMDKLEALKTLLGEMMILPAYQLC
ncbi:MAG: DUF1800 family protein [bacterium]